MFSRLCFSVALLAFGFAVGSFWSSASGQGAQYQHPGLILDRETRQPLAAAVTAWPLAERTGDDGRCGFYGDEPLHATESTPDGRFVLSIDPDRKTFTATYCRDGYLPREDPFQSNETDGSPVSLVRLRQERSESFDYDVYRRDVMETIISLLNEAAYLFQFNPSAFADALGSLTSELSDSPQHAEIAGTVGQQIAAWGSIGR